MMDRREAHGTPFSAAAISEAKAILGVPDEPFHLDPELPAQVVDTLERAARGARGLAGHDWPRPAQRGAALLERQLRTHGATERASNVPSGSRPGAVATRKAMQRAMDALAPATPGLTAGSADLTDNTGVILKNATVQGRQNPGGRQIHYGIREFAMGATMVGQALHGGIRPVGSTFFVFSDYMRPALRLAALSEAPAIFVFTHDSVGVGEDGPTHEPVEHLMALRAMPRPARRATIGRERDPRPGRAPPDATHSPRRPPWCSRARTSRCSTARTRWPARAGASRGGYVVREDRRTRVFTLVGTGF